MSHNNKKSIPIREYFLNSPYVVRNKWQKGEFLCREGSELNSLHFLLSGKFRIFRTLNNGREMLYRIYLPGSVVGDIEVFTGSVSASCSVQCIKDGETLTIQTSVIKENLSKSGDILFALGQGLARKLHENSVSEALNTVYPLNVRLGHYFLTFRDPELKAQNLGQLADWMGCSYRHLTRTLSWLKKNDAIRKKSSIDNGTGYEAADLKKLELIAKPMMMEEHGRRLFEPGD